MQTLKIAVDAGQNLSQRIMQDRFLLRITRIKDNEERSNVLPFPLATLPVQRVSHYRNRNKYGRNVLKRLFGFTKGRDQVVLVINREDARV